MSADGNLGKRVRASDGNQGSSSDRSVRELSEASSSRLLGTSFLDEELGVGSAPSKEEPGMLFDKEGGDGQNVA